MTHAREIVTVEVDQTVFRILDILGTVLTVVPRTSSEEVTRHNAYGTMNGSPTHPLAPPGPS